jgi:hypothetical protein
MGLLLSSMSYYIHFVDYEDDMSPFLLRSLLLFGPPPLPCVLHVCTLTECCLKESVAGLYLNDSIKYIFKSILVNFIEYNAGS